MSKNVMTRFAALMVTMIVPAVFNGALFAAPPVANAVPFVASNPTSPHTSWSGNQVTLKGTLTSSAIGTDSFTYDWNPGDGGADCTGTVTNPLDIECPHTYTGAVGTVYTAVLTITDTTTSTVSPSANCPPPSRKGPAITPRSILLRPIFRSK